MGNTRLAGRIPAAVFLVGTVGLAVEVVVFAIVTDLGAAATPGTGRIPAAVAVSAIDIVIAVIVQAIVADLGVTSAATAAGRVTVAVFLVRAVDLVVAVVVDAVVADLGLCPALAHKCIGALIIVAVCIVVAIIVGCIVTDLGCTGVDGGIVVVTINFTAAPAFGCKAVTVIIGTFSSRTEIGRVIARIQEGLAIAIQRATTLRIDMAQVTAKTGTAGAVDTIQIRFLGLCRTHQQAASQDQNNETKQSSADHASPPVVVHSTVHSLMTGSAMHSQ
jgi:hypothetical protein